MIPKRSPRFLALLITGTLVGALFASPALAAKPPRPGGTTIPSIPDRVSPSTADDTNYVRFDVTFTNTRSSSLQQVTLADQSPTADPDPVFAGIVAGPFVDGDPLPGSPCGVDPTELNCAIGTVEAGSVVTISVVYTVPVTTLEEILVQFIFTSTGAPGSDPGTSHGDDYTVTGKIILDSSNYAGTYLFDASDLVVATDQALTKRGNPQSTQATGPQPGFPLTVEEVSANDAPASYICPATETCFGQWSVVNVNNGLKVTDGFVVVIGYDSVPGSASAVEFVHLVGTSLTPSFIREECDADTLVNCIDSVDNMNGDLFYTLILDNNGPIRGI